MTASNKELVIRNPACPYSRVNRFVEQAVFLVLKDRSIGWIICRDRGRFLSLDEKEQKQELHKMTALGMTKAEILAIFYPETDVAKMREIR